MYRETIYKTRDNVISFALDEGSELQSASGITKCKLAFKRDGQADVILDSSVDTGFFTKDQESVNGQRVSVLSFKLGPIAQSKPIADGIYNVEVYLYDAVNTNGVFWDSFPALVRVAP